MRQIILALLWIIATIILIIPMVFPLLVAIDEGWIDIFKNIINKDNGKSK